MPVAISVTCLLAAIFPAMTTLVDIVRNQVVIPLTSKHDKVVDEENSSRVYETVSYMASVDIGVPPQRFQVLIDTGSALMWLPYFECLDSPCTTHQTYVPRNSRTHVQRRGQSVLAIFGTGRLLGHPENDHICLGSPFSQACTEADFYAADQETVIPFKNLPFDGILGLGLNVPSGAEGNCIACKLDLHGWHGFSIRLGGADCVEHAGEVVFGWRPPLPMPGTSHGPVQWATVPIEAREHGYWQVVLVSVHWGDVVISECTNRADPRAPGCGILMDTGTNWILGPEAAIAKIRSISGLEFECSNMASLPNLHFELIGEDGPIILELNAADYMERTGSYCQLPFATAPADVDSSVWVAGQVVLRQYLTMYDVPGRRMGFARISDTGTPSLHNSTHRCIPAGQTFSDGTKEQTTTVKVNSDGDASPTLAEEVQTGSPFFKTSHMRGHRSRNL